MWNKTPDYHSAVLYKCFSGYWAKDWNVNYRQQKLYDEKTFTTELTLKKLIFRQQNQIGYLEKHQSFQENTKMIGM
jgi:hypothetical protein